MYVSRKRRSLINAYLPVVSGFAIGQKKKEAEVTAATQQPKMTIDMHCRCCLLGSFHV